MNNFTNLEELENGNVILIFSTDWCPDCVVLKGYLDKIVELYQDKFKFIYVDRDENIELAKHYSVFGIPSFVALKDGEKIGDFISTQTKTFDQVVNFLESLEV